MCRPWPAVLLLPCLLLLLLLASHAQTVPEQSKPPTKPASTALQIRFDPFRPSTEYRCGAFTEQQGPQKDAAMRMLHSLQNELIQALSAPFPHQKILSDDALLGQLDAWKRSLLEHRDQWIRFDRWWLLGALLLSLVPPCFVLLFLLARCCVCLCQRGKKKAGGHGRRRSDRRWDWLRRLLLNALLGILVLANVFCAAVLLLSTQYAQHGLDELPTRLHYCVNDLHVYRSETAEQVRKLLRDDFGRFNQSLQAALDGAGQAVVHRLKDATGVLGLEQAVTRASSAGQLRRRFGDVQAELGRALDARHSLQTRLLRLRQAREGLADCERTAKSGDSAALCHQARQTLAPVLELATGGDEPQADWEGEERPRELAALLPEQLPAALSEIERLDIEQRFATPLEGLQLLQHGIQSVVDGRREDADERIRLLDRTLQSQYEQISSAIKAVDLRFLDEQLLDPMMRQREHFRLHVQYGWLAALVLSGLFAFLALAFLLGLCFGCCGRRPSEFDDDDCCVRSTGANFFACSTWLSLALISVFGLLSALAMLLGANTGHLVCHPLREPLARPDMLSLADRLVSLYRLDQQPSSSSSSSSRAYSSQIFTAKRRPADLVRGCARGQTLYAMFELDKKFALLNKGGGSSEAGDEYEEMANSIRQFLLSGRLLESAIGQAPPQAGRDQQHSSNAFGARWYAFSAEMRQALEALGRVEIGDWEEGPLREFCAQKLRYQLEPVLAELRRLRQTAEEQPPPNGGPVEELESVLRFMEELRPDIVQVRAQLESACARLEQLHADSAAMHFNSSALLANLERSQAEFSSEQLLRQKLHAVASEVAGEFADLIRQYAQHVNESMYSEVSSCGPLVEIARHTRAALCDYALDPLNSLWLALGVGIALLLPTILLSTALNPLYQRTRSYPKYTVPSSSSQSSPNENRFATDIYGLGPASYSGGTTLKAGANSAAANTGGLYQPSLCTQITSPYATGNYGYQELGPPVYMGTSRR